MTHSEPHPKPFSFRSLYVYLVSVAGIIMMVIGAVQLTQYLVNRSVGPKYRLQSYEETSCQYLIPASGPGYTPTEPEVKRATEDKDRCMNNLEDERAYRIVADLANALVIETSGVILFVTHFGILRKRWDA